MASTSVLIKSELPCPSCGSSDAFAIYSDGHGFCFSCRKHIKEVNKLANNNNGGKTVDKSAEEEISRFLPPHPSIFHPLKDRGISSNTAKFYGVENLAITESLNKSDQHLYPIYDLNGKYVGAKIRYLKTTKNRTTGADEEVKAFRQLGFTTVDEQGNPTMLFGQNLFPPGSAKQITITEGECDAMAVFEMSGSKYPVISVRSASSAQKDCRQHLKYLNSFEQIVICFDADKPKKMPDGSLRYPGQEAAEEVARLFKIGKVRIVSLKRHKDANEYLQAGEAREFINEWWGAPVYSPRDILLGCNMWDSISEEKSFDSVPYPWSGLQDKTYGIRLSEMVLITADTGIGKTTILKEMEKKILDSTPDEVGIGLLHLEEPTDDTALGLMSIAANKPLHLPDIRSSVSKEELRKYYDDVINNNRVVMWEHFGSGKISEVLDTIRMMHNVGCKYIFMDHLSILVSDQSGDERKQLDEASTKLKQLCMELNIALIVVIHQNRQGSIRGSAGPEQVSNIVIKAHRDKKEMDDFRRSVTFLEIEKNRFCGRTGPACYLHYNEETGRLNELSREQSEAFKNNTPVVMEEEDFSYDEPAISE